MDTKSNWTVIPRKCIVFYFTLHEFSSSFQMFWGLVGKSAMPRRCGNIHNLMLLMRLTWLQSTICKVPTKGVCSHLQRTLCHRRRLEDNRNGLLLLICTLNWANFSITICTQIGTDQLYTVLKNFWDCEKCFPWRTTFYWGFGQSGSPIWQNLIICEKPTWKTTGLLNLLPFPNAAHQILTGAHYLAVICFATGSN